MAARVKGEVRNYEIIPLVSKHEKDFGNYLAPARGIIILPAGLFARRGST